MRMPRVDSGRTRLSSKRKPLSRKRELQTAKARGGRRELRHDGAEVRNQAL